MGASHGRSAVVPWAPSQQLGPLGPSVREGPVSLVQHVTALFLRDDELLCLCLCLLDQPPGDDPFLNVVRG